MNSEKQDADTNEIIHLQTSKKKEIEGDNDLPSNVLHQVEHFRQRYHWDCGVSCVLMLLNPEQRQYFLENFHTICQEEGFGESTWTIDLCYLLKRFNISHRMYSVVMGINEDLKKIKYYKNMERDRERVQRRFSEASARGVRVQSGALSDRALRRHLARRGPAILLVDSGLLACDLCHHNRANLHLRRIFGGSYSGHYVLVVGYARGRFLYRDPALRARLCALPAPRLRAARTRPGTDNDLVLVYVTTTSPSPPRPALPAPRPPPVPPDEPVEMLTTSMSKKTVFNEYPYRGLVEARVIPAELHSRADGRPYASFGSVVPIHCCTQEQVSERAQTTHHICGVFSDQLPAPLGELAYVRLDENTAEKVFINRTKRVLLTSWDGSLAQWRATPTFESANHYLAGAPLVNKDGQLVAVVTARKGNHYAVSNFEGDGGYFETPCAWVVLDPPAGSLVYGDSSFPSRDLLRAHIAALPPAEVSPAAPPVPVLQRVSGGARVALVTQGGRQLAHCALHNVLVHGLEYL